MRLRNNPRAPMLLAEHPEFVIFDPKEYKGKWHEFFKNNHPIYVEFGMGRGQFITTHAKNHPENNYIGVEVRDEVVVQAMNKVLDLELKNIALLPFNIMGIEEVFDKNEVDTIYLNFSDPWPKVRHGKRRLTHRLFLEKYKNFLKPEGMIVFKTDNRDLFDFSVEEFKESGFELLDVTYDLYKQNDLSNVPTEYETKFAGMGMPIHRLKAIRTK